MSKKKILSLEELKVLVFEKGQATKKQKSKLFKLAKTNNDIETIEKLGNICDFKRAKIYLDKLNNLSTENEFDVSKMGVEDLFPWQYEIPKEHYKDASTIANNIKIIITSPLDTTPELQTAEGALRYQSRLSKLTHSELNIELSNVMAAKHNLMSFPTHPNEAKEIQEKITDLTDKALSICIQNFGNDMIINYGDGDIRSFNGLVNEIDAELAQEVLNSEQHGRKMLDKINLALSDNNEDIGPIKRLTSRLNSSENYLSLLEDLENGHIAGERIPDDGVTPLHIASYSGRIDLVTTLLNNKAEIDSTDNIDKATPLIRAIQKGHHDIVETLLESGANPDTEMNDHWTPLLIAANAGEYNIVKTLIDNDVNIDCKLNNGANSLILASSIGNVKIVKLLIEKGIDINQQLDNGFNSLMIVISNKHIEVAKELVISGINVNAFGWDKGESALSISFFNDNIEMFEFLLEQGVRVNQLIEGYHTILDICIFQDRKDYVELLIKNGAKRCNLSSSNSESEELILNDELIVEDIFHKVDSTITSSFIAKQFILEEIDSASLVPEEDNPTAKEFVDNSGFNHSKYKGALDRSLPEVDGGSGGQQILNKWLMPYMFYKGIDNQSHKQKIVELRYKIIDLIMQKYSKKVRKISIKSVVEGSIYNLFIYPDYIQNDKLLTYEKITNNKYYNPNNQKYIEIQGKKIFIYSKTYNQDKDDKKSEYQILDDIEIYEHEIQNYISNNTIANATHNPKKLVEYLTNFTIDTPMKYTTHEWRKRIDKKYLNNLDLFLNDVTGQLDDIKVNLQTLSPNLYQKIHDFIISKGLSQESWCSHGDVKLGWSSLNGLEEWVDNGNEPWDFELEESFSIDSVAISKFGEVVKLFKGEIETVEDTLQNMFLKQKKNLGRKFNIYISDNLKGEKFYTDVQRLNEAIDEIFKEIKKYAEINEAYKVEVELHKPTLEYVELHIVHFGSDSDRNGEDLLKRINSKGDSVELKNKLLNLCDWYIEANYKEDAFRIDCFSNDESTKKPTNKPEGFTHILKFYN